MIGFDEDWFDPLWRRITHFILLLPPDSRSLFSLVLQVVQSNKSTQNPQIIRLSAYCGIRSLLLYLIWYDVTWILDEEIENASVMWG